MLDDSFPTMGTMARVVRDGDGDIDVAAVFAEIERRLSRFDPTSDLSRLNADPRVCVPAAALVRAAVSAALRAARLSGGLVDPTVLGAVRGAGYQESRAHVRAAPLPAGPGLGAAASPGSPRPRRPMAHGEGRPRRGRDPPAARSRARPGRLGQGMGGRRPRSPARAARAVRRGLRRRPAPGGSSWSAVGGARAPSAQRGGSPTRSTSGRAAWRPRESTRACGAATTAPSPTT